MNNHRMCLLERFFKEHGFVLVHDGRRNPCQYKLPPSEVSCYTMKYQLKMDGEFVNTWVVFKYDNRSRFADFEIYSKEPKTAGREKMILNAPADDNILETRSVNV